MQDEVGNDILVGDIVVVTHIDSGRGAHHYTTAQRSEVISLGRSRVEIQLPNYTGTNKVGADCMKVVQAVDGRVLRTWADVHAERRAQ